ncbi:hypothetical protein D0907_20035 (plasmid) [Pseudoalteromonas lipolytica]|uniref:Uncharacterized domain-containing protein n=1 Tax=Pseudoalteromonas lipolytica TaxID=570156 RepID=A0AAD0WEM6_9GAMM|nr:MobH family relaxase [Pseudoalteromonas donghaensis]AXV67627.1 hypothetical protein D0907_20035 [Pseudoalteromonas donghaensis]
MKLLLIPFTILIKLFFKVQKKYLIVQSENAAHLMRDDAKKCNVDLDSSNSPELVNQIIDDNKYLIAQTRYCFGNCHDWEKENLTFQGLFIDTIKNYARYCGNLPASEGYHHAKEFGLIEHSLQVADLALRQAKSQFLPQEFPLDIERQRTKRYQYAAWLCGLVHDAGKMQTDMDIYDKSNPNNIWIPIIEDLVSWKEKNKITKVGIRWRKDRIHKGHEVSPQPIFQQILTPDAKRYIGTCPGNLLEDISTTLANYQGIDGYLQRAVRSADYVSTAKDIQTTWDNDLGARKSALHEKILKLMQDKAKVWLTEGKAIAIDNEIYLRWPECFNELAKEMHQSDPTVPNNPSLLREKMMDRGILRKQEKTDYALFFETVTNLSEGIDLLISKNLKGGIGVIRLEWPLFLLKGEVIPPNRYGLLKLDMGLNAVIYSSEGYRYISEENVIAHEAAAHLKANSDSLEMKVEHSAIKSPQKNSKPNTSKAKGEATAEEPIKPNNPSEKAKAAQKGSPNKDKPKKEKPKNTNGELFAPTNQQSAKVPEKQNNETTLKKAAPKPKSSIKVTSTTKAIEFIKTLEPILIDGQNYYLVDDKWKDNLDDNLENELEKAGLIERKPPALIRYFIINKRKYVKAKSLESSQNQKAKKKPKSNENQDSSDVTAADNTSQKAKLDVESLLAVGLTPKTAELLFGNIIHEKVELIDGFLIAPIRDKKTLVNAVTNSKASETNILSSSIVQDKNDIHIKVKHDAGT